LNHLIAVAGGTIIIGLIAGYLIGGIPIGKFKIPAVAGYVLSGVVFGQSVLNVLQEDTLSHLTLISDLALGLVALTIGGELTTENLRKLSKPLFPIVLLESLGAMILVILCIQLLFHQWTLSLILGAISAATAPAATVVVIRENRASGVYTNTLLAIVAIDNAIALIIYGFTSAIAKAMITIEGKFSLLNILERSLFEIFGAIALGIVSGLIVAPLLRRIQSRDTSFSLSIGAMFLIIGVSSLFHLSAILANMALGIVISNIAPNSSKRFFQRLDALTPPIYTAFFVIAGAHLRVDLLVSLGFICLVYLVARVVGKISGAALGAAMVDAPSSVKKYIGFGLISQVGIAIGLSLVVNQEFAHLGPAGKQLAVSVINILLATTIVTEVIGPILTKYALIQTGEAGKFNP
jgi:Kef-type K+ transport system membrane component KefB